jgi:hypothetical protein
VISNLLVNTDTRQRAIDSRAQQYRRAVNGVGAEHEQVACHATLRSTVAINSRGDDAIGVIQLRDFTLQTELDVRQAAQIREAILECELRVDRAQVAAS